MGNENQNNTGQGKGPDWRALEQSRDNYKSQAEENLGLANSWKNVALQGLAHRAGYDPTNKVTQLVLEKFAESDDLTPDELSPDTFQSFAKESYELEPNLSNQGTGQQGDQTGNQPGNQGQPPNQPGNEDQNNDALNQFNQFQQQAQGFEQATQGTPQVNPNDIVQQIAQAESSGEWSKAMSLKMQLQGLGQGPAPQQQPQHTGVNPETGLPTHS